MEVFAFTVLVLILAVLALYFWNRFEKAQVRSDWRKQRKLMQSRIAKLNETSTAKIAQLENKVLMIESLARKNVGLPEPKTNPFTAMEDRYAKQQLEQVIGVQDKAA